MNPCCRRGPGSIGGAPAGWTPSKAADRRWAVIGGGDSPRGSVDSGLGIAAREPPRQAEELIGSGTPGHLATTNPDGSPQVTCVSSPLRASTGRPRTPNPASKSSRTSVAIPRRAGLRGHGGPAAGAAKVPLRPRRSRQPERANCCSTSRVSISGPRCASRLRTAHRRAHGCEFASSAWRATARGLRSLDVPRSRAPSRTPAAGQARMIAAGMCTIRDQLTASACPLRSSRGSSGHSGANASGRRSNVEK